MKAIREKWNPPEKYLLDLAKTNQDQQTKQEQEEKKLLFDLYIALYQEYIDVGLTVSKELDAEHWRLFVAEAEARKSSMAVDLDPDIRRIASK